MKKRATCVLLVLCLLVPAGALADEEGVDSGLFQGQAQTVEDEGELVNPFSDVPDHAEYAEAVITLAAMGIFKGDENGSFCPNDTLTRAQTAAILCRLMGVETDAKGKKDTRFDDVARSHWASGYIEKAAELGVINGYGDGGFRPGDPVNFQEIIKMLVCAFGYKAEAQQNGGWPNGYIAVAEELGITNGLYFHQTDKAPRSMVAQLIYNLLLF